MSRSSIWLNQNRILALIVGVLLIVTALYYFGVARPAKRYAEEVQSLSPSDVEQITITVHQLKQPGAASSTHILARDSVATFLSLISRAYRYSPNHPIDMWQASVTVKRHSGLPPLRFAVHGTSGDGVQIGLWSWGEQGWYYGTLRNDDLGSFIAELPQA